MKKNTIRILSLLLALLLVSCIPCARAATGVTYYISGSAIASDSNDGTSPQTPWRTVAPLNAKTYLPAGTKVLFEGGYRYGGNLLITPDGTAAAPVEITSYGQGVATLTDEGADKSKPILMGYNAQYLNLHHLDFEGTPGTGYDTDEFKAVNKSWAIMLAAGGKTESPLGWLTLSHLNIRNTFGGIEIVSNTDTTGYNGINITDCVLDDVYQYGIFVIGLDAFAGGPTDQFTNVHVRDNIITDMHGDPYYQAEIQAICVASGEYFYIENNTIAHTGGHGGVKAGENPIGGSTAIGVNNCRHFTILYNRITDTNSNTDADASAIDIDQDAQHGEVAFNLTYNNYGPSVQVGSFSGKTAGYCDIHHNISYNDVQGTRAKSEQGVFRFFGNTTDVNVFNNTVYLLDWKQGTPSCVNFEKHAKSTDGNQNIQFFNNIFQVARRGGVMPVIIRSNRLLMKTSISPSVRFFHNAYSSCEAQITICNDPLTGDGIAAVSDSYTGSLYDWQQLGQEMVNGRAVGLMATDLQIPLPSAFPEDPVALMPATSTPCKGAATDPWAIAPYSTNRKDILGATQAVNAMGALTVRGIYRVTAPHSGNLTITGEGQYFEGDTATLTITPATNHHITGITLNGDPVTLTDGKLTFTVRGDALVLVTTAPYSLQEYLNNAGGQPVYLSGDFDLRGQGMLHVPAGTVLDLNGHKLYADIVIAHGTVRDSQNGQGLIVMDKSAPNTLLHLSSATTQWPMYDTVSEEKGYRLFDFALNNRGTRESGATVQVGVELYFSNSYAYRLLTTDQADTTYSMVLNIRNNGNSFPFTYYFRPSTLVEYGHGQLNHTANVLVMSISGLSRGGTFTAAPQLESSTTRQVVGQSFTYVK